MGQVAAEPPSDHSAERVVILVAGGDGPVRALLPLPTDVVIVAADSGVDRARSLGWRRELASWQPGALLAFLGRSLQDITRSRPRRKVGKRRC